MDILHPAHGQVKARPQNASTPSAHGNQAHGQAHGQPASNGQVHATNGQPLPNDRLTAEESAHGLFAAVPLEIAARKDLSLGAKLLFGIINSLQRASLGRCVAGNDELAKRIGESNRQTRRWIHELEERQLIARDLDHGRRHELRVTWKPTISGISTHSRTPQTTRWSPVSTEKTLEKKKKTTTKLCGVSSSEFGSAGDLEESSSFLSLPESGRPDSQAQAIEPARLAAAVAAVLALGLRHQETDAEVMDAAMAEKLILGAAQNCRGGLRWVAWAVDMAAGRRNLAKGRLQAKCWSYIVGTIRHWRADDGAPPADWPGERAAAPRKTEKQYNAWA